MNSKCMQIARDNRDKLKGIEELKRQIDKKKIELNISIKELETSI